MATQFQVSNLQTIISPQATSILNNGVFYNKEDNKFYDKYKNELAHTWVCYTFWSNENSKNGSDIADLRLAKFCSEYNIVNKKY